MLRSVILLLLAATAVVADDPSDVRELDADSFAEGVEEDIILVEFYAPW